ncbi:MAG: D-cysteine desulfhydrase family protein [Candidatus Promineifilaceae bacterium]
MTHIYELRSRLEAWPRLKLGSYPTPLEPLPNLTKQLAGPQLWIKRDDTVGPGLGGNKARKLEFLMAEVVEKGKEKVVTFGGLQSNHARMTAAACAPLGVEAHLFYFDPRPKDFRGNLLLNQLLGARMHFIPFGGGNDGSLTIESTNRLVRMLATFRLGPGAYFIPVGGHNVLGCLGYVNAALEIQEQLANLRLTNHPVTVITAAGTGGTLAGLMAGFGLVGNQVKVLGIDIGKLWRAFPASIARLASDLCSALGETHHYRPADTPVIENRYAGPGYARVSDETIIAIETMAQTEGIMLDPVYTGKAFAGLIDLIRDGRFREHEHVVFLHTGGYPALWADEETFAV